MDYDIVIIGAGPAGYVSAIRAGQLGLKTAIIEKENVGGMCLNWGCIPSKSMLESAKLFKRIKDDSKKFGITGIDKKSVGFDWAKAAKRASGIVKKLTTGIGFLLKKNNVEIITGEAEILDEHKVSVNNRTIESKNIILATGASPKPVPENIPKDVVVEIKDLFGKDDIPENIVVFGETPLAIEMAQLFRHIGKTVTLVAPADKIMPRADEFLSSFMLKVLKKDKIELIYHKDLSTIRYEDNSLVIGDKTVSCDMVLNTQRREAIIPKSSINLKVEDDFISTDENCKTPYDSIYAIGDMNGKSYYAHIASAQGLFVVNRINGVNEELNMEKYPMNMYTTPEMAQIGKTEQQVKDLNLDYKINEFSLAANGKALTEGTSDGAIRIISDKKYGEVLGVQIISHNATDMISEASAYMQLESTVYDIANTVHAHPTISEVFMEAGFDAIDSPIHK
ncbi:MAG: dihydrolipoyl dehydrogenase [Candidatus Cloacimonadota bacterium]|nr:MAG: dihydrolipoyl dehydrogenase [Candidatus Cloacimonadota bacterium]PIE81390.1 MAG: dihydrolipoyl dehydrogenase [Candidatus Delongbacteria bacterium]